LNNIKDIGFRWWICLLHERLSCFFIRFCYRYLVFSNWSRSEFF